MNTIDGDFERMPTLSPNLETAVNSSDQPHEKNTTPLVSFGLPVYNAEEKYLCRLLDSLLAQDLQDLEIVISDNASKLPGTQKICEEYASRDPRVRYHRNPENIGQIDNFNKVLELSRGKYFRWIGSDDWLETDYARRCVEVLEAGKNFISVTTYQDHIEDDGKRHYEEYKGERLDSPLPYVRFRRMLWFMTADFGFIDPIYTMMRREMLLGTNRIQHLPRMDQVLAVELCLLGPFSHIPACLAHRRREDFSKVTTKELSERYNEPGSKNNLIDPTFPIVKAFLSSALAAPISNREKILCLWPVIRFAAIRKWTKSYRKLRKMASSVKSLVRSSKKNQ